MKSLFIALALLGSVSAFAESGKDAAYKVCDGLFSTADKTQCVGWVARSDYFDLSAVAVCGGLFSSDDKVNCIATIADKSFDAQPLKVCAGVFSSSDKITCLKNIARTSRSSGCNLDQVKDQLDIATSKLSRNQPEEAQRNVSRARSILNNCRDRY